MYNKMVAVYYINFQDLGGYMKRLAGRHTRGQKHILFWSFPILITVLMMFFLWYGGTNIMGKVQKILEEVLAMVTIV